MIITRLVGGLGNQIFQWAIGKSLSEKFDKPLYLDINFYKTQVGVTKRNFALQKFPSLKYKTEIPNNDFNFHILTDNFNYTNFDLQPNLNYYLDGYWQTEKYFENISTIIKNELSPSEEILTYINNLNLVNQNSVSLHIRRTDYVNQQHNHPVLPIEYYQKALDIIGEYENILVFSDDIEWCKNHLYFNNMVFIENNDEIIDLFLMSTCKNNIIANSSFSWWGAWLNKNLNKKVISPNTWFGSSLNLNTSDIIPNNWIKI
jgi:hypothetical protein